MFRKFYFSSLAQEIVVFLVLLTLFSFIPMSQLTIQGSIFILSLYALVASLLRRFTFKQLGFVKPSKEIVVKWVLLTLGMIIAIVLLKIIFPDGIFRGVSKNRQAFLYLIPFYVLIGTFFQEFVFRGYLFAKTSKLFSIGPSVTINIFLFSIFHIPYFVQYQSNLLYLSIIAGVCWAFMYAKYPNLYMVWISHGIVGSLSLLLLQKF